MKAEQPKPSNEEPKFQIIPVKVDEFTYKPVRLTRRQINVYNLLKSGKRSVTELTNALGYADPRSYIRYLRDKGINVLDRCIQKQDVRFKIYWID